VTKELSKRKGALLALTFLESFAGVLLSRGVYFYTHDRLAFDATENLLLGLAYGALYIAGASASHRVTEKVGEKRLLSLVLLALVGTHAAIFVWPTGTVLGLVLPAIAFLLGVKWPIVESFMSAGETPRELLRMSARYNVTWASSVPLGLSLSGTMIASSRPETLFLAPAVIGAVAFALCQFGFPERPVHLDAGHPERPDAAELARYGALTVSARWAMMLSYSLIFLLAPLMPEILARLGLDVAHSTPTAALLDFGRLGSFVLMAAYVGWRLRSAPLALAIVTLPVAFCLVLFANHVAIAVLGEALLGLAAGFAYYSALYYALVAKNASVDAGGAHEALIGLGYALGPLAGLAARAVGSALSGETRALGILAAASPLIVFCAVFALRPLFRLRSPAPAR
jgi:Na+/melibiose symporter-like transporter